MKNPISSKNLAASAVLILSTMTPSNLTAQPPAQGPPRSTTGANKLFVDIITSVVMNTVNQTLAGVNADLAANPNHHAVLKASEQHSALYMTPTTYTDRPNQFYANLPYHISYTVSNIKGKVGGVMVPYPFSRTISQTISVQTTCEGWYTGRGHLNLTTAVERPYLEGDHSFAEDVIGFLLMNFIPNLVDQRVRGALGGLQASISALNLPCTCKSLGVSPDAVLFNKPGIALPTNVLQPISVKLIQVKRLPVHRTSGEVVGDLVETPELQFWAGHSELPLQLASMVEGQTWLAPANATVSTPLPGSNGLLVLIGSMVHNGGVREDNSFITYSSATNFGNGTQVFNIMKNWMEPSTTVGGKPVPHRLPGYQITVQISVPTQVVLSR